MDLDAIISKVPDFKTFYTLDEMDASTRSLERDFPGVVTVFEAGKSRKGHPLLCIKIGDGPQNALVFACPHPNEPIGAMTCEFLTRTLAGDKALRDKLGYTWFFIKCIDPDGVRLNEKWFKGPYSLYNYCRNYYRPPDHEQVEWTFPIDYKELHFHTPMPETQALMRLMEEYKPSLVYSLHNSDFGGAYWYLTRRIPEVYDDFYRAAAKQGVARHLSEPETPFCEEYAPAVFRMMNAEDGYDFTEKMTGETPTHLNTGTSSYGYALSHNPEAVTLVTELPYFSDPRIQDMSLGHMSRKEALFLSAKDSEEHIQWVLRTLEPVMGYVSDDNPFIRRIDQLVEMNPQDSESKRAWALSDPEFEKPATVASIFDNTVVSRFYRMPAIGLVVRTCEHEIERLEKTQSEKSEVPGYSASETASKAALLEQVRDHALDVLRKEADELEKLMDYSVIEIKRLVSVQAESGLALAMRLRDRR